MGQWITRWLPWNWSAVGGAPPTERAITPRKKGNLKVSGPVSIKDLHQLADQHGAIRAGSTINPKQRARQYTQEGYSGTMYYANTENMMRAENNLFENHTFRHNVQSRSNCPEDPGYVYVIKGKKFS